MACTASVRGVCGSWPKKAISFELSITIVCSQNTLVGFDTVTPFILQSLKQFPQLNRDRFTVRTDSDVAQLNLIRAGAGIGMCQVQLADFPVPLQRIMPEFFAFHLDTWLVMHEDLRHSQACKTVFDFLAEDLQGYINRVLR